MPNRKLAVFLAVSMGLVALSDSVLSLALALQHKSYILPLALIASCIPGFVIAALAWQGRLPSKCATAR